MQKFLSCLFVFLLTTSVSAQTVTRWGSTISHGISLPETCSPPELFYLSSGTTGTYLCSATNTWIIFDNVATPLTPSAAVPSGLITFVVTGSCPTGWTEVSALSGKALYGTVAANKDVGNAIGADSITPVGTNGTVAFTPSGTISYPVNVPLFTGTASTTVVNHVHVQNVGTAATGSLVGYTYDASTNTSVASGYSTANPTGGSANYTPVGTIAWPANPPTFTGSSGTVLAQTFTGTQFDNRSAGIKVIFCSKD